jgi:hypothetical protein
MCWPRFKVNPLFYIWRAAKVCAPQGDRFTPLELALSLNRVHEGATSTSAYPEFVPPRIPLDRS